MMSTSMTINELNGAENKKFYYKQFKILDKTDKESN